MLVAAKIVWTGSHLVWRSISGLKDIALPPEEVASIRVVLDSYQKERAQYHSRLTRQAAASKFVTVHVLVPGDWTVQHGHDLLERIEQDIRIALPNSSVLIHLEALDAPS